MEQYDDGETRLCDEHYIYDNSGLSILQIARLTRTCRICLVTFYPDN